MYKNPAVRPVSEDTCRNQLEGLEKYSLISPDTVLTSGPLRQYKMYPLCYFFMYGVKSGW